MFLKTKPNKNNTNKTVYNKILNSNPNFDSMQLDELEDYAFLIFYCRTCFICI